MRGETKDEKPIDETRRENKRPEENKTDKMRGNE